ncbi:MAG TPA: hypothetical protein VN725_08620 [Rhodanobacteraceae bacterium]|nr:hypothetical protein [Rhodanobacteraceae bacterium]
MSFERTKDLYRSVRAWVQGRDAHDRTLELVGATLAEQMAQKQGVRSLHDVEFRVFSQFGDDGIIQWLIRQLPDLPKRFVEFGVEDYSESNTRFLMINNNWRGLVMDGSAANIARLRRRKWFWRHDLTAEAQFLTRENVDSLIAGWLDGEPLGLLHIDVDGNEYWLWEAVRCASPAIAILEYNALFGCDRAITIPYRPDFRRFAAHYSGQYFGASLAALTSLAQKKGYTFLGCNSAGNNAYYVRDDLLAAELAAVSARARFVEPAFRESRDSTGRLDYLSYSERQKLIRGLPVVNVLSGKNENF